jgi:hypothetical protein
MENMINALSTNFDLLDFLYVQYKIPNKKEDNFFFDAEYIEKKDNEVLEYIKLHPNEFKWETLCYYYSVPWLEDLIDKHFNEIDWLYLSKNPKIIWSERLINKYWDKIWFGCIISYSATLWNEKLVRFALSITDEESTKIFWIQKFSQINNIQWSLKMILDLPTSYWIREVLTAKTLEYTFEDLKKYKKRLNKDIFGYLQVSSNLFWTNETILEFGELLDFHVLSISKNVDWSSEIISNFDKYLNFEGLSKNQSIPLDDIIIKKYELKWDFDYLNSHSGVKWNLDLIKSFINKINLNKVLRFTIVGVDENFIHEYRDYIYWGTGCGNYTYNPAPVANYTHIPINVNTLIEKATDWEVGYCKPYWEEKGDYEGEWHQFSSNQFLTALHLETFAEKLSWDLISSNEYLTITTEMLLKFSDKWDWPKVLNRSDFKLEHFYAIHQYLNFEILSAQSFKVFEILKPTKDTIFTHIKDNVEIAGDFRYSLRTPNYTYYREDDEGRQLLFTAKRLFLTEKCKKAADELTEINNERNEDDKRYYHRIHYWLREYFKVFDKISYVSDSLERESGYTREREIQLFFALYLEAEEDFKKNYFDVYKRRTMK